jgi:hypothetical protein
MASIYKRKNKEGTFGVGRAVIHIARTIEISVLVPTL